MCTPPTKCIVAHFKQRDVAWAAGSDQHMIDRGGETLKKVVQGVRVVGVERSGVVRTDIGRRRSTIRQADLG